MAYSQTLASRIEDRLNTEFVEYPTTTKKMFGGIAYMLGGNIAVGIIEDDIMARVGPDAYEDNLALPGVSEFDITGRPMKGWVRVSAAIIADDADLARWILKGLEFAATLPEK